MVGTSETTDRIQSWLLLWGHSVVRVATESAFLGAVSVRRVDAAVVVCGGVGLGGICPASLPLPVDAAPLMLVGGNVVACRRSDEFLEVLPRPGRRGRHLRRAVRSCVQKAELARRHLAEVQIYHEYIQFLGHETRTPLTSALAALEILEGELADGTVAGAQRSGFARLASRNLRRLGQTLEWTEDYLTARTSAAAPRWREGRAGDFITRATGLDTPRPEVALVFEAGVEELRFLSDEALLRLLLRQVIHALRYHVPGTRLTLRISSAGAHAAGWEAAGSSEAAELVIALHAVPPEGQKSPGPLARAGLTERGETPEQELARLLQFTVSRELLQLFGARLTVPPPGNGPALLLVLPVTPPGALPTQSCELRVPVCV